jgi:hypothetical protein
MKFSKKIWYSLFGALILINIILRYPEGSHEVGSDSYLIHSYANSITGFGYATWIIHPYSFIGLTPDSYPSAVPFILSSLSQCMDLNLDITILLLSFVVGLIGLFGALLLAKQIKNDDIFIFMVGFLFSTSPIFLRFTIWTTATRHLFIALLPFFLWGLLRVRDSIELNWKYIGFSIIIFVMLMSTHRLGILLFLVILAFIVTYLIYKYFKKFEFNRVTHYTFPIIWITVLLALIFLQIMNIGIYKNINITFSYQTGQYFSGSDSFSIFMNWLIDYGSRTGILSIFGIFGFFVIFFKRSNPKSNFKSKRNFNEVLLLLILLFSSSFVLLGLYLSLFLLPILIILSCIGILWFFYVLKKIKWLAHSRFRTSLSTLFIIGLIIVSVYFSFFMIKHWSKPNSVTNELPWIEEEIIDTAFYYNEYGENINFISNSGFLERKIVAWQAEPRSYKLDLSRTSIEKGNLMDLITQDTLYIKSEGDEDVEFFIPGPPVDDKRTKDYLNRNNIHIVIEEKSISGRTILYSYSGLKESAFLQTMYDERYKIYENNLEQIWYV